MQSVIREDPKAFHYFITTATEKSKHPFGEGQLLCAPV